jgi:hypothetical protein
MEHHVSFPFTRGALLRLCAVACVDAKRLNLTPLVEFMTMYRDLTVKRVNVLAVHPQRQLNINLLMSASPRWVSIDLDAPLPLKKPVLPKAHFHRWFRYNVHDPSAEQLRDDREFSGSALTRYQQVVFEPAIVDALRRGRRPDEIATMSHHDMVMMKMLCYAKYLHPTSPALTADDVDRVVAAFEFPVLPSITFSIQLPPGVDIDAVGVATLRRITTNQRTFPCAAVELAQENKKDVNDRNKWQPKPARTAEVPAKLSDVAKLEAVKRAIGAYSALHGIQVVHFDAKKHGVYSLIGVGAQPVCDDIFSTMRVLRALDRADAHVWMSLRSVPYSAMSMRQLNGLHVGLMTRDELIESLPANLLSRANAAEMRHELGVDANGSLADATVERLRLFVLLRSSARVIEAPAYLLERRKALMGGKSAVVCDGYVITATSGGQNATELLLTCSDRGYREEDVLRALIATAIVSSPVDLPIIVDLPTTIMSPDEVAETKEELRDVPPEIFSATTNRLPNASLVRTLAAFKFKRIASGAGDAADDVRFYRSQSSQSTPNDILNAMAL